MRFSSLIFSVSTIFAVASTAAHAADGLVEFKSPYSAKQTMDRMENVVKERGLRMFVRVDHAAGAASVGRSLRPTEVMVFGSPQGGTPLLECGQTVGIDLPLKALVWEDTSGQVWLGFNDPAYVATRHGVQDCPAVAILQNALTGLAKTVVAQ